MANNEIHDKLLRAIDRRDPWSAVDLIDWLREHGPDYIRDHFNEKRAAIHLALAVATELGDDPAFPAIVANLREIAAELGEKPIAEQLTNLVQAVYALEGTFDNLKYRSSHIIASGEAPRALFEPLTELHKSLTYTMSIAEFIDNETKGENPRTIKRTDLNAEYDHLWTDDLAAMPVSYASRVDALFKAVDDLNRVPTAVQDTRLVWATLSFHANVDGTWTASARPAVKAKHWNAAKALHLVQALDAFNRGEEP